MNTPFNFCYNAYLQNGGIAELQPVTKFGIHQAQTFLARHGVSISLTKISQTTAASEHILPNQKKYIELLGKEQPGIVKVAIEFYRTEKVIS